MEFDELLAKALSVLNERRLSNLATAGTVAAAFLTDKGNVLCQDSISFQEYYVGAKELVKL